MQSETKIRRVEREDSAVVAKILYDSFAEFEVLYTHDGFAATTLTAERVLARMEEGPVWLALREAEALGTVAAVVKEDSVYIRGMAVHPAARGLGVGARLLEVVEDWAVGQGVMRVFLSTTPFLHAAIRLYESHGFERTRTDAQDLFGTPLFTMEKKIPRRQSSIP